MFPNFDIFNWKSKSTILTCYTALLIRIELYKNTRACKYTLSLMFCSQDMVLSRQQL